MKNADQMRRALEDIWRERTQIALQRYREAKHATAIMRLERSHGLTPTPDGALLGRRRCEVSLEPCRRTAECFKSSAVL